MSASLRDLRPELYPYAVALVDAAGASGLMPRVTSTRRSHAEQERLYRRAQSGQQPYPVARPGTSAHEYGWAFDMVVSPMDALSDVGAYWEQVLGGVWGGHPGSGGGGGTRSDPVHFEYPGWRSYVDWNAPDQRGVIQLAHEAGALFNPFGEVGQDVSDLLFSGPYELGRLVGGFFSDEQ